MNTHRATPAELDAVWLPLEADLHVNSLRLAMARQTIAEANPRSFDAHHAQRLIEVIEPKVADLERQVAPFEEEWKRRGGWTRYPYVMNQGGHYHQTRRCSTCFLTTQFGIVADTSGLTRGELVEKVGHHACTTCFPEAPTLPSWQRTIHEEKADKDARRDAKTTTAREKLVKRLASANTRLERALVKMRKAGATDLTRPKATDYLNPDSGDNADIYYAAGDRDYARDDIRRLEQDLAAFDRRHGL